jgi:hypothetical protein
VANPFTADHNGKTSRYGKSKRNARKTAVGQTRKTPQVTRLERERRRRGLGFAELGDALGVTESAASRYCKLPDHRLHRAPSRKPKEGEPAARAPANLLRAWSSGKLHLGNYSDLVDAPAAKPRRRQ